MIKRFIKWSGGKANEIKYFKNYFPISYNNYYEPFIGGGSVLLSLLNYTTNTIKANKCYINDLNEELYYYYLFLKNKDKDFFYYISNLMLNWKLFSLLAIDNKNYNFNKNNISLFINDNKLMLLNILGKDFNYEDKYFFEKLEEYLLQQLKYSFKENSLETVLKKTYYTYLRKLYNLNIYTLQAQITLFYFLRNYCFAGMFRTNKNNEFNVPYGKTSYNKKDIYKNLIKIKNDYMINKLFKITEIYNKDFIDFFHITQPQENDFIFLDPPYDSSFSKYNKIDFTKKDHIRLVNYLKTDCKAKWLMVIKETDFINVKHLIIKNY